MVIAISQSPAVLSLPARERFAAPAGSSQSTEQGRVEQVFGLLFGESQHTPLDQLLDDATAREQVNAIVLEGLPLPSGVRSKSDLTSQALLLIWDAIEERGWRPRIEQHAIRSTINPKFLVIQSRLVATRDATRDSSTATE